MTTVVIPDVFSAGFGSNLLSGNGYITNGSSMAALANALNMITARRGKVHLARYKPVNSYDTSGTGWHCRFLSSPYCTETSAFLLLGDAGAADVGGVNINIDGVDQLGAATRDTASALVGPSGYYGKLVRLVDGGGDNLAAGTTHDMYISLGSPTSLAGVIVYESWAPTLDTSSGGLAADVFHVGNPITGRDIAALTDQAWNVYKKQGTTQISSVATNTQTGTTWKNLLDSATTGYASTAAGFWTVPYRQNTLAGTTVSVVLWTYADSDGTTGRVRFVNSAGTIGTISSIIGGGSPGAFYTTTATLDASLTSDLVVIEISEATAGKTISVYGAGIYALET